MDGDPGSIETEVNIRLSAAHLLQALEEERREANGVESNGPAGRERDELDAQLAHSMLEEALHKAKEEYNSAKEEWIQERRQTHRDHTATLDRMNEGIEIIYEKLLAVESNLAVETNHAEVLEEALATAEKRGLSYKTLEALESKFNLRQQEHTDAIVALRAANYEREQALEAALQQSSKHHLTEIAYEETSAKRIAYLLKQETLNRCNNLRKEHAEELRGFAKLTSDTYKALQRSESDMTEMKTIHDKTLAQIKAQLEKTNNKLVAHAAAIKIQTASRRALHRRNLRYITKQFRACLQSQRNNIEDRYQHLAYGHNETVQIWKLRLREEIGQLKRLTLLNCPNKLTQKNVMEWQQKDETRRHSNWKQNNAPLMSGVLGLDATSS